MRTKQEKFVFLDPIIIIVSNNHLYLFQKSFFLFSCNIHIFICTICLKMKWNFLQKLYPPLEHWRFIFACWIRHQKLPNFCYLILWCGLREATLESVIMFHWKSKTVLLLVSPHKRKREICLLFTLISLNWYHSTKKEQN